MAGTTLSYWWVWVGAHSLFGDVEAAGQWDILKVTIYRLNRVLAEDRQGGQISKMVAEQFDQISRG